MSARRFDQLLAGYADGDAISHEVRQFAAIARDAGWQTRLFAPATHIAPRLSGECFPLESYDGKAGDVLLYHFAIASPAAACFRSTAARRLLRYHNITPSHFFRPYDTSVALSLEAARNELPLRVAEADAVWADSAFNAAELAAYGASKTRVMPLCVKLPDAETPVDDVMRRQLGGGFVNWLFVGRIVPNKCVEDLLLAFAWYHRAINPRSRLVIVGSERSCPRYAAQLRFLSGRLDLANVFFTGFLDARQLEACHRCASVYLCASRHEGFCLPLLDAMAHGVPVIARDTGGVPEAMGDAGVRYGELSPRELAVLADELVSNAALRQEVLASQSLRVAAWRARNLGAEWARLVG
ncbi:MAG: glycosyltransferase [Kiritimatiellae bacterium]|nr:glycosyltransferase [Kiritimatiellia bacterium]